MVDRPMLYSAPMVRALRAGVKTQTRRVPRPMPFIDDQGNLIAGKWNYGQTFGSRGLEPNFRSSSFRRNLRIPAVGDRIWGREAWRPAYDVEGWREDLGRVARPADFDPATTAIEYLADGTNELGGKRRPGIHMPRWASRITLTVRDVRIQRLQDITDADAVAEGVETDVWDMAAVARDYSKPDGWFQSLADDMASAYVPLDRLHIRSYETLWRSLHPDEVPLLNEDGRKVGMQPNPARWDANPFVVATTFSVTLANVDTIAGI